ncbi:MAG: diguanylate cyclase [Proteobacteria bacterium]|nr:diguanylate cyclase [Pseudomonadota bacterium]MBU4298268.1 diguanylate cyclase [Pseudomonadota bacterium]MCG2747536.1 diguanylate cyclase [Desulfobulbaceae bacterium]
MNKILVVDNNPVIRKMLSSALEKEKYQVECAEDGLSAFDCLDRFVPDIIFLDLIMPNINGEQFCQMISGRKGLEHTKIVVISGVAVEAGGECEMKGVHASIAKGPQFVSHVIDIARKFTCDHFHHAGIYQVFGAENLFPREISKELLAANRHLKVVLNNMSEGIVELAVDHRIIFANPAAAQLAGMAQEKLLASDFAQFFSGNDQIRVIDLLKQNKIMAQQITDNDPVMFNHQQVAINFLPVHDRENSTVVVIIKDISKTKIAEERLRETKEYLHSIFNSVQAGIIVIDVETNIIIDANLRALELYGIAKPDMLTHDCRDLLCPRPEERSCPVLQEGKTTHLTTQTVKKRNGQTMHILKTATVCMINNRQYIIESFLDITEQKKLENKLHSLSITDELTGLLNRRGFMMMAKKQLRIADRNPGKLFLLFADVDNLKWVNDTYGHDIGDMLLVKVAKLLASFRRSDIIARLGGDEFAVLLSDSSPTGGEEKISARFESLLYEENEKKDLGFPIEVSFGVVAYDNYKPCEIDELIVKADKLMYSSKKSKKI